jgi:hypothetical protein
MTLSAVGFCRQRMWSWPVNIGMFLGAARISSQYG